MLNAHMYCICIYIYMRVCVKVYEYIENWNDWIFIVSTFFRMALKSISI